MDSSGVYCTEFLDRLAAFDRGAGRPVEVPGAWAQRSGRPDGVRIGHVERDKCLAGTPFRAAN